MTATGRHCRRERITIDGREYEAREMPGGAIGVMGPRHFKRPSRGVFDCEKERWMGWDGLSTSNRFYRDANRVVERFEAAA